MSIIGSNVLAGASGSGVEAYEIEQSLRFNGSDSAYLINSTPSTDGNRKTYTISVWVKKIVDSGTGGDSFFFATADAASNYAFTSLSFGNADAGHNESLRFLASDSGASQYKVRESSTAAYRDYSAWMHVVAVMDTTQSTAADRVKIYVNGEQITNLASVYTEPAQNYENYVNGNNAKVQIGRNFNEAGQGPWYFDGYLAEYHLVDGTALDPEDFGEYDDNGVWRPIRYTGSHGTNGFYLKFDPDATNGIGHDHSGNGNDFTANNFTTSGTGTDVMDDTPTNNFATLNPIDWSYTSGATLSNGALYFRNTSTTAYSTVRTGFRVPASGKYYFEFTLGVSSNHTTNVGLTDGNGNSWNWAHGSSTSNTKYNGTNQSTEGSSSNGVVCAYAINNGQIRLYRGNTLLHTWSQSASGYVRAFVSCSWSNSVTFNFGQRAFTYTPPTDHVGWATSNLPEPEIADGSDYFNTVLYSGNGTSQSLTVGFQPDWIWTKPRNATGAHVLVDAVRGNTKFLESNSNGAEQTRTGNDGVTSFDTNGYSIGSSTDWNASSETFVSWNWLAGNGTSSNTNGGITSTVSVSATSGFSIVSWEGSGNSTDSVGHGLGVAPKLNIIKSRDSSSLNWYIYTTVIDGSHDYFYFTTGAKKNSGIAAPTSTVINLNADIQPSGQDMIAYSFAEVEGYSKFGTYTGNGSSNGPFVWCGFRPAWVLMKPSSTTGSWSLVDSTRSAYNVADDVLFPNLNNAESTSDTAIDFLSNGFKLRSSNRNTSGATYLFIAFASNPFGGDGVSPATAR